MFFGIGIGGHYAHTAALSAVRLRSASFALESCAAMDLLEYQGKQLFARHGLKVSSGLAVTTVDDAVLAADEVGYPIVVKAQVLIGGRGKAGGGEVREKKTQGGGAR